MRHEIESQLYLFKLATLSLPFRDNLSNILLDGDKDYRIL